MNNDEKEFLANKILKEAIENIERLGFKIVFRGEYPETIQQNGVFLISEERHNRGDY